MKVLLINPPWFKEGYYGVRAGSRWPHFEKFSDNENCPMSYVPFPFFMAYAASMLLKEGFDVKVLDAIAENIDGDLFYERVNRCNPNVVVMEVSTPSLENDLRYAERIKSLIKDVKIILCGADTLTRRKEFLEENRFVDFVVIGEYEKSVCEICRKLDRSIGSFSDIKGILYREKGEIFKNEGFNLIEDINSLPWPARELFPMEKYIDSVAGLPLPSLQVWASRGCPFNCNFCLWPQIMYGGRNYRVRDADDVAEEIKYCLSKWHFESFYFDDDTFNIGKERIIRLANAIKEKKINRPFAIMARADTMDEEQIAALKEAGLYSLKYGVESGVQEIVDKCGKGLDLSKVETAVNLAKKYDVKVHLTFAFGLEGETKETIRKTVEFACKLNPDSAQFSIITPFPGSRYYEDLDKKGYIVSKNWEDYTGYTKAVIRTDSMSEKDLEDAYYYAVRKWRGHLFKMKNTFSDSYCKEFLREIKGNRFCILYSSFEEHIEKVVDCLGRKEIVIAVMSKKESEAKRKFGNIRLVVKNGETFSERVLHEIIEGCKDYIFVVPVNNPYGKGYEGIFDAFLKRKKHFLIIDEYGKVKSC